MTSFCRHGFLLGVFLPLFLGSLAIGSFAPRAEADEGMWLFSNLPLQYLAEKYDFRPDDQWANKLMRSSVRFNVGGSASFVSPRGLVLTNHHVGSDTLQKLSSEGNDILAKGFLARTTADEIPAPDLELNQLLSIKDVTAEVNKAVEDAADTAAAAAARRAVIAKIEKAASEETGNRCNVITLYGGGRYHLYEYKKYTDVRLVWAPEADSAFFGGDADNFEYPRYCLDACLFRVYEDDKPAVIEDYLKWNSAGPEEGELIFVSGNPGSTSRIFTTDALKYQRDIRMPDVLDFIRRREILLQQYSLGSPEKKRRANDEILRFQNSRKAYMGMLGGLQNPAYFSERIADEKAMLAKLESDPALSEYASAWKQIGELQAERAALRRESFSLNTRVYQLARTFVRLAMEDQKPNEERLPEFRDSGRASLERQILSPATIYRDLERVKLADLIARTLEIRGGDSELGKALLQGKSPAARADEIIANTRMHDAAFRKQLYGGDRRSILTCGDPLIELALVLNMEERRIRAANEELDEIERQAYAQIAEVLFAIDGTSVYPDATFTLRLTFGVVKGYEENGKMVPAFTKMSGAFQHQEKHGNAAPWILPQSWHAARDSMQGDVPLNFVSTADIIGGNSGSPVVNKDLEMVGLIFDGNIQSLTSDFFYSEKQGRAISVHAGAITTALRNIYDAAHIADELEGQSKK
ncbi:MAG: S46 family peptidase [Pirellulaceae bacterium]|nr:S46 family peptidase [Pirellulaceae bacterium]